MTLRKMNKTMIEEMPVIKQASIEGEVEFIRLRLPKDLSNFLEEEAYALRFTKTKLIIDILKEYRGKIEKQNKGRKS